MSPAAQRLLAALAEGYEVEVNDPGGWDAPEYRLAKRMKFEGDMRRAAQELRDAGLVDTSANGSGNCWINDKGRAALPGVRTDTPEGDTEDRISRDRRDAERYRALRDDEKVRAEAYKRDSYYYVNGLKRGQMLDDAIDAKLGTRAVHSQGNQP